MTHDDSPQLSSIHRSGENTPMIGGRRGADKLRRAALHNDDVLRQITAVKALARNPAMRHLPTFLEVLADAENFRLRKWAEGGLHRLPEESLPRLVDILCDDEVVRQVRTSVAEVLRIKVERGISPAVEALAARYEEDPTAREHVAWVLRRAKGHPLQVDAYLTIATPENADIYGWYQVYGGAPRSERVVPRLVEALHTADDERSLNAWWARRIMEGLLAALGRVAVPALIAYVEETGHLGTVVPALARMGREARAAIPMLHAHQHRDPGLIRSALWHIGDPATMRAVLAELAGPSPEQRRAAAHLLREIDGQRRRATHVAVYTEHLTHALTAPDRHVQRAAAWALGEAGDARAVPGLVRALHDDDDKLVRRAAAALGKIGEEQAVPALREAMAHSDITVRKAATRALVNIGGGAAFSVVVGLASTEDQRIRRNAVWALGRLGHEHAASALIERLRDADPVIVWKAANALTLIGGAAALTALREAAQAEGATGAAAAWALHQLEGAG